MSQYEQTQWENEVTENNAAAQAHQEEGIYNAHAELDAHIKDFVAQPANGGTTSGASSACTAYSITTNPAPADFIDKMGAVFTAHADSGANPTLAWGTLAAKPVIKSNKSAAVFKKDSVYTVRYSTAAQSFILQGEGGGGSAVPGDLLVNKTATVDIGDITGTMPDRSGDTAALSNTVSGTTLKLLASDGYRDGVNDYVTISDPDFIAGNIRYGKEVFGITGTVGGTATASDILSGKTAAVNGGDTTGTMPNNGAVTITPGTADQAITLGYHNGSGKVLGSSYLISGNIRAGAAIFGVNGKTEVVDTTEGTSPAGAAYILSGKIAFVNGVKITGTMTNNGAVTITPGTANVTIAAGYHCGGGYVLGDADLITGNIKTGINIFGITGNYDTEGTYPAAANHILSGKIAFVNGAKITGTMANNGAVTITPGTANVTIAAGYHNGSGYVVGDADLVTGNIRAGVSIFGVSGKTQVVDTTEGTNPITASDVLTGHYGWVNGARVTGTVPLKGNNPSAGYEMQIGISTSGGSVFLKAPAGLYQSDTWIKSTEGNAKSENVKLGVSLLGMVGTGPKYSIGDSILASNISLNDTLVTKEDIAAITTAVRYYGGYVYIGRSNVLYKLNLSDLSVVWSCTVTNGIQSIGFDSAGNVYVGQVSNLAKVSPSGIKLWDWRVYTSGSIGVAVDSDDYPVVTISSGNAGVWKLHPDGTTDSVWIQSSNMYNITDIVRHTNGMFYVTAKQNTGGYATVNCIGPDGVRNSGDANFPDAECIAVDPSGNLWVGYDGTDGLGVVLRKLSTYNYTEAWKVYRGTVNKVIDVATDPSGNVYVADNDLASNYSTISKLTNAGAFSFSNHEYNYGYRVCPIDANILLASYQGTPYLRKMTSYDQYKINA
jgi:hypothetical protein